MNTQEDTPRIRVAPEPTGNPATEPLADRSPQTVVIPDDEAAAVAEEPLMAQYRILEKIGDGGMGVVYLARDTKLGRFVAIKRIHRSCLSHLSLRERFFREAKVIAALSHIHIVHVYTLGEDHHGPYIVMEYVAGPAEMSPGKTPPHPFTLADLVHKEGPLPVISALDLLLKLCRAIDYAHKCGVIHRDLKPSNVLLNPSREPKIVDFGLARMAVPGEENLTVPGERMLSLGYGAPEQEADASLTDERADVYGLGALLYFSITGKNPRYFRENDVPEALRTPIVKALETDRDRRWSSAAEFMQALLQVKAPSSIELPTVKTTWRCKWCDTVNPVATQYCGTCGWDGSESCTECGASLRVGIPFCGECGADAREYETVRLLLSRLRDHVARKDFDYVTQNAQRVAGFKPVGAKGQQMVADVGRLRDEARQAIERRAWLKEQIPREIQDRRYETAISQIEEYNRLAADTAFAAVSASFPELLRQQQLARVRQLTGEGNLPYAERLCRAMNPETPGVREALDDLLRVKRWRRREIVTLACLALFAAYTYGAAPVYRLLEEPEDSPLDLIYAPVRLLRDKTVFQASLDENARLWGVPAMFNAGRGEALVGLPALPGPPVAPVETDRLMAAREDYRQTMDKLDAEYAAKLADWPKQYLKALRDLQETVRKQGDFEGWMAVSEEIERFSAEESISEDTLANSPPALRVLQNRFEEELGKIHREQSQHKLATSRQYVSTLTRLQQTYTMQGKMGEAAGVHNEVKRVETSLRYIQAELDVAAEARKTNPAPQKKP